MTTDLFGQPDTQREPTAPGTPQKRKTPKANGYAARPGSGPQGETCGTCQHLVRVAGGNKSYRKCGFARAKWTHGPGSDIQSRAPACLMWQGEEP